MQQAASRYSADWRQDNQVQAEESARSVTRTTTKKVNQHRKLMVKCGLAVFAYAILLVFMCSKSAGLGYDIENLNKDIAKLEADNQYMEYKIAQGSSLSEVERIAVSQLGMQRPEENSALAMEITQDPVEVASKAADTEKTNVSQKPLHKIYKSLSRLAQNM